MRLNEPANLLQRHPTLKDAPGFTSSYAKALGVKDKEIKKTKGFICVGLVREIDKSGNTPRILTSKYWVFDEELWDLKRKAHRNPREYNETYLAEMAEVLKEVGYGATEGE